MLFNEGNNRDIIFVADENYQYYLKKLKDACKKYDCALHAYILMTNHVHLLITPYSINGTGKVMQYIELNPVRAGMVGNPTDYPWSSYHYNALGKIAY